MLEDIKFKNMDDEEIDYLDFGIIQEGNISKVHIFLIENESNDIIRDVFLRPYRYYESRKEDTVLSTRLSLNGFNFYSSLNFTLNGFERKKIYVVWQPPVNASIGLNEWSLDLSINKPRVEVFCPE